MLTPEDLERMESRALTHGVESTDNGYAVELGAIVLDLIAYIRETQPAQSEPKPFNLNIDPEWLLKAAEAEAASGSTSVGGLYCRLKEADNDPITALFAEPKRELAELQEATRAVVAGLRAAGCRNWKRSEMGASSLILIYPKAVRVDIWIGIDGKVHVEGVLKGYNRLRYNPTDPPPVELVAAIRGANDAKSH